MKHKMAALLLALLLLPVCALAQEMDESGYVILDLAATAAIGPEGALEGFLLSQALDGLDYGPLELAALVEDVTKEDVVAAAQGIRLDAVYFLKGESDE